MEYNEFWQSADANEIPAVPYIGYDFTIAEDATIDPGLLQAFAPDSALPFEQHNYSATIDPGPSQAFFPDSMLPFEQHDYSATIYPGPLQAVDPALGLPLQQQDLAATMEFAPSQTSVPAAVAMPLELQDRPVAADSSWPGQSFAGDLEHPAQCVFFSYWLTCRV